VLDPDARQDRTGAQPWDSGGACRTSALRPTVRSTDTDPWNHAPPDATPPQESASFVTGTWRAFEAERMTRTTTSDRFGPGQRVGDYHVEHEVTYEEYAVVYLATHVVLPRQAYIKVA